MQDGAYYASITQDYLNRTFSKKQVISRSCDIIWSPPSPDLNSIEYLFSGTLQNRVFHNNARKDLIPFKDCICELFNKIKIDEIAAGISNLQGASKVRPVTFLIINFFVTNELKQNFI